MAAGRRGLVLAAEARSLPLIWSSSWRGMAQVLRPSQKASGSVAVPARSLPWAAIRVMEEMAAGSAAWPLALRMARARVAASPVRTGASAPGPERWREAEAACWTAAMEKAAGPARKSAPLGPVPAIRKAAACALRLAGRVAPSPARRVKRLAVPSAVWAGTRLAMMRTWLPSESGSMLILGRLPWASAAQQARSRSAAAARPLSLAGPQRSWL